MFRFVRHGFLFLIAGLFAVSVLPGTELHEFAVGGFSGQTETSGIPKGWEELAFKKIPSHTQYSVIREGDRYIVKGVSRNSASGILRQVDLDPKEYPILRWCWKVEHVIEKADARRKDGDDYPARIYVAFKYDPDQASFWEKAKYGLVKKIYGQYPPKGALNYIWDNKLPIGTSLDNAYTDRTKMVVMESGKDRVGQWIFEKRNIHEDYKNLFGSDPPRISFIAIMTDTDNTHESAVGYFSDIVLETK